MTKLAKVPNIGPKLYKKLNKIGVDTYDDLVELGSIEAVLKIGEKEMSTCYNMLFALEGAILNIRWHAIPKEERHILKQSFDQAYTDRNG